MMSSRAGWSAVLGFGVLTACWGGGSAQPHVSLGATIDPLRTAFNADSGKVRAIFLASPTCGECLSGASKLQSAWLAKDPSTDIAVFVVWSPQLGAEEKHVAGATGLVPGARTEHYWDQGELAGRAFQGMLDLSAPAWDVWMLFDRDAMWRDSVPPTPAWWEHQLGAAPAALHLDPARFASRAEALKLVAGTHR